MSETINEDSSKSPIIFYRESNSREERVQQGRKMPVEQHMDVNGRQEDVGYNRRREELEDRKKIKSGSKEESLLNNGRERLRQ